MISARLTVEEFEAAITFSKRDIEFFEPILFLKLNNSIRRLSEAMPAGNSIQKRLTGYLAPRILKWMLLVIFLTCRKKWLGTEHLEFLRKKNKNWIYSLWHNNITYAALLLKRQNMLSLVSSSRDGSMAATIVELLGNKAVRGSSSRGGTKALLAMIRGLKSGQIGAITPDGPRGPKYCLQSGAISISQKSSVPIVPIHFESTRQWIFTRSWDKHKMPKPFSTIVAGIGSPFQVPAKMNKDQIEAAARQFETQMMDNVRSVKNAVNQLRKIK